MAAAPWRSIDEAVMTLSLFRIHSSAFMPPSVVDKLRVADSLNGGGAYRHRSRVRCCAVSDHESKGKAQTCLARLQPEPQSVGFRPYASVQSHGKTSWWL